MNILITAAFVLLLVNIGRAIRRTSPVVDSATEKTAIAH